MELKKGARLLEVEECDGERQAMVKRQSLLSEQGLAVRQRG